MDGVVVVVVPLVPGEGEGHGDGARVADVLLLRGAQLAHKPQQAPPELNTHNKTCIQQP